MRRRCKKKVARGETSGIDQAEVPRVEDAAPVCGASSMRRRWNLPVQTLHVWLPSGRRVTAKSDFYICSDIFYSQQYSYITTKFFKVLFFVPADAINWSYLFHERSLCAIFLSPGWSFQGMNPRFLPVKLPECAWHMYCYLQGCIWYSWLNIRS